MAHGARKHGAWRRGHGARKLQDLVGLWSRVYGLWSRVSRPLGASALRCPANIEDQVPDLVGGEVGFDEAGFEAGRGDLGDVFARALDDI